MTLEEAIKTAIEYENKVRDLYAEATAQAPDEVGKRIFELLTKEEQEHVDYLQSRLDEWNKTGKIVPAKLGSYLPEGPAITAGMDKLKKEMGEPKDRSVELALLKRALAAEDETSTFYKKMVSELDAEGQQMFERFVEIEEGHYAMVQAQIDALSGVGFWFDFQEFNLEAG